MEDENGLELSLALPCSGSSSISKKINCSSSDVRIDDDDRGTKLINDFKSFLNGGTDTGLGSLKKDPVKPEENFFNNLSKAASDVDASTKSSNGGLWVANDNSRPIEVEEAKKIEIGSKRKIFLEEISQQNKREKEVHHTDLHEKTRTSHISITTDDGSTAENEDVADSEAEASTSRPVLHHDNHSTRNVGSGGSSEVCKEVHRVSSSNAVESHGQKSITISSEKDFKDNTIPYSISFPAHSMNVVNVPYLLPAKESNPSGASSISNMVQVIPTENNERPGAQPVIPANIPLMYGYSPVQIPVLDKDGSQGLVSHPQQLQLLYPIRGAPNMDKQNDGLKISQASIPAFGNKVSDTMHYDGRLIEQAKGDGKQAAIEDDAKRSGITFKSREASGQIKPEGFPCEFPAIRPGIAADLKFGGCGSYPNLPWVSTTGNGPNGRTISGVTYRYSATQIRIVCACHGSHMSAEEFVQHANEDQANADTGTGLESFPNSNHASAQG